MTKVLIVDDDAHIREVIEFALTKHGYKVIEASNGKLALELFDIEQPDLVLLDIMMPELDGIAVCQRIRANSNTPIIFVSAMDDDADIVLGLEIGGDDYVAKPFSVRQIVARIKAVLRRADGYLGVAEQPLVLDFDNIRLNSDTYQVTVADNPLTLTVTEFNLLKTLMTTPNKVFSRAELIDKAYDGVVVSDRTIDSHIRRLRKKFTAVGSDPIHTLHGAGYSLRTTS